MEVRTRTGMMSQHAYDHYRRKGLVLGVRGAGGAPESSCKSCRIVLERCTGVLDALRGRVWSGVTGAAADGAVGVRGAPPGSAWGKGLAGALGAGDDGAIEGIGDES